MIEKTELTIRDEKNKNRKTLLMPGDVVIWPREDKYVRIVRKATPLFLDGDDAVIHIENMNTFCDLVKVLAAAQGLHFELLSKWEEVLDPESEENIVFRFISKQ